MKAFGYILILLVVLMTAVFAIPLYASGKVLGTFILLGIALALCFGVYLAYSPWHARYLEASERAMYVFIFEVFVDEPLPALLCGGNGFYPAMQIVGRNRARGFIRQAHQCFMQALRDLCLCRPASSYRDSRVVVCLDDLEIPAVSFKAQAMSDSNEGRFCCSSRTELFCGCTCVVCHLQAQYAPQAAKRRE